MTMSETEDERLARVLAEELPPDSIQRIADTPAPYNASELFTQGKAPAQPHGNLNPYPPGVSGNPGGVPRENAAGQRYTIRRALREELTATNARRIAAMAVELAAQGSPRHMEFVRDTDEGKPGTRMDGNEWAPAEAAVFQQMMMLRAQSLVAGPQTPELEGPAD